MNIWFSELTKYSRNNICCNSGQNTAVINNVELCDESQVKCIAVLDLKSLLILVLTGNTIQIVTDVEVTIENYFPVVGNIPRGRGTRGIFPTTGK